MDNLAQNFSHVEGRPAHIRVGRVLPPPGANGVLPTREIDNRTFVVRDMEALAAKVNADNARKRVNIDYDHNSVYKPGVNEMPRTAAAGWVESFYVAEDGGLNAIISFNEMDWDHISSAAGGQARYKYLSFCGPVNPQTNEILAIESLALTNAPAMQQNGLAIASRQSGGEESRAWGAIAALTQAVRSALGGGNAAAASQQVFNQPPQQEQNMSKPEEQNAAPAAAQGATATAAANAADVDARINALEKQLAEANAKNAALEVVNGKKALASAACHPAVSAAAVALFQAGKKDEATALLDGVEQLAQTAAAQTQTASAAPQFTAPPPAQTETAAAGNFTAAEIRAEVARANGDISKAEDLKAALARLESGAAKNQNI